MNSQHRKITDSLLCCFMSFLICGPFVNLYASEKEDIKIFFDKIKSINDKYNKVNSEQLNKFKNTSSIEQKESIMREAMSYTQRLKEEVEALPTPEKCKRAKEFELKAFDSFLELARLNLALAKQLDKFDPEFFQTMSSIHEEQIKLDQYLNEASKEYNQIMEEKEEKVPGTQKGTGSGVPPMVDANQSNPWGLTPPGS